MDPAFRGADDVPAVLRWNTLTGLGALQLRQLATAGACYLMDRSYPRSRAWDEHSPPISPDSNGPSTRNPAGRRLRAVVLAQLRLGWAGLGSRAVAARQMTSRKLRRVASARFPSDSLDHSLGTAKRRHSSLRPRQRQSRTQAAEKSRRARPSPPIAFAPCSARVVIRKPGRTRAAARSGWLATSIALSCRQVGGNPRRGNPGPLRPGGGRNKGAAANAQPSRKPPCPLESN